MKKNIVVTGIIAIILALVTVPVAMAAEYANRDVLHVWLETDKDAYKIGEEIYVTLKISNKARTDRAKVTYLTAVVNLPDGVFAAEEDTYAFYDGISRGQTKMLGFIAKSTWNKTKPTPEVIVGGEEMTTAIANGAVRQLTADKTITVGGEEMTIEADVAFVVKMSSN